MQRNGGIEENEVESSTNQSQQQVEQRHESDLTTTTILSPTQNPKIKSEIIDQRQNSPEISSSSSSSYQLYPSSSTSLYPHNEHSHPIYPPSSTYSSASQNRHFHHDQTTGSIPLSSNHTSDANSSTLSCGNVVNVAAVSCSVATTTTTTTTLTFTQSQASFVAALQAATTTVPFHNPNPTNPTNLNPNPTNSFNPNLAFGSSYPQSLSHLSSSTGPAQMLLSSTTNFCAASPNSRSYPPATSFTNTYLHPETAERSTGPTGTLGAPYTHAQTVIGMDTNLNAVMPSASFSTQLGTNRDGYNGSGPMDYANETTKLHDYPSTDPRIGVSPLSVYSNSAEQFREQNRMLSFMDAKRQRYSSVMSDGRNSSPPPTTTNELGTDLPRSHSVAAPSTSQSPSNQIPSQSPQPSTATYQTTVMNTNQEKEPTYRSDANLSEDRRKYSSDQRQSSVSSNPTQTANEPSQRIATSLVTSSSMASSEFASSSTTQFKDSINTTLVRQPLQYVAYFPANVSLPVPEPFTAVMQHSSGTFLPSAPNLSSRASVHSTNRVFEPSTSFVSSNLEQILVATSGAEKITNSDSNDMSPTSSTLSRALLNRAKMEQLRAFDNEQNGDKISLTELSTSQSSAGISSSFSNGKRDSNIITQSEADAMDVSTLNEMLGVVAPKNRGNSHLKREWRNVGWFTNEEEMNAVRKQQKVSKWKSVDQISGLKVFFRCNKWKRTNCNYRMFVMYYAVDRISLNESGQHDHSVVYATKSKKKCNNAYNQAQLQDSQQGQKQFEQHQQQAREQAFLINSAARAVFEATPSSSQQSVLDQLIRNATANAASSSFDAENVFDTVNSGVDGICGLKSSTTSQGIADVAADMDLTFTFNSRRTCEYCFESNTPQMKGRMIVFSDLGDKVGVAERFNGVERGYFFRSFHLTNLYFDLLPIV
ncbi:unnamed protein product [Anisakis simplex]|uniref:Homeobox domain-containing protein n=1 Tax=Anisakis simplex TaxID=6269 RepID=A0A0M3K5L5_ANISI|nr:unnamed protein product [Anisakis simplex]